jgi:hypothetical protein
MKIIDGMILENSGFRIKFKKIKYVVYSFQGSHTGQLDFFNWLADGSTTG